MRVYIVKEMVEGRIIGTFLSRQRAEIYLGAIMVVHRDEVYECFKKRLPLPQRFYSIIEDNK